MFIDKDKRISVHLVSARILYITIYYIIISDYFMSYMQFEEYPQGYSIIDFIIEHGSRSKNTASGCIIQIINSAW